MIDVLQRDGRIEIPYIVASIHSRENMIEGIEVRDFEDYCPENEEILLVVNFPNFDQVQKAFFDAGKTVQLIGLDQLYKRQTIEETAK